MQCDVPRDRVAASGDNFPECLTDNLSSAGAPGGTLSTYAIGVDFGTESGRAVLVDVGRRPGPRDRRPSATPTASSTSGCRSTDRDVLLPPDWALQDPEDYLRVFQDAIPAVLPSCRRRSGRCHRRRHRLHRLHDAADHRRRHAALPCSPSCAPSRMPGSSSGSTTPPSPRPTGSTTSPARPASPGWTATAGRSRRSGSSPSRSRSSTRRREVYAAADRLHRGGRLGRLAADRRRDPQRLHRRLQGDVVEARRLPAIDVLRRARPAPGRRRRRRRCRATSVPMGERAGGLTDRGRRLDRPAARDRGRHRQRRRPRRRARRRRSSSPGGWS